MAPVSLTPSQRLTLIKEIAARLEPQSWPLIDATLGQFSLPRLDGYSGGAESYILKRAADAPDQSLIELAQHLGFQFEGARPLRPDPTFWRKGMLRLFISHLATHKVFASELQTELLQYGIYAFVAHSDIEPTSEWLTEIEAALATCEALVALLHEKFHESKWTDQEIGFAMGRGVPAFAVRLGETPYGFIGRFQAFNGYGRGAKELARELFDSFRKNRQTHRRMGDVLVGLFEGSESFARAKYLIGLLEEMETWEPSFPDRITAAVERNSQVSGSFGVKNRVKALSRRWENPT